MPDQPSNIAIGIGGSGARTAEALLYLCAAGLGPESLTMLFVDADTSNGSLKKVVELAKLYQRLQAAESDSCPLFHTRIHVPDPAVWTPFHGKHQQKLSSWFDYSGLLAHPSSRSLGKLMEALYTEDHRDAALDDGFLGKPSIGAAVLGHSVSREIAPWTELIGAIKTHAGIGQKASIFAMGSIFGGTGAAGLPTIPKLLREAVDQGKSNVCLGAALLLPYFSFHAPEDVGQTGRVFASPDTFLINSKEALRHYSSLDLLFDRLYLVGAAKLAPQKNFRKGGEFQDNLPHFVELVAANGATDFFRSASPGNRTIHVARIESDDAFTWNDHPDPARDRPALANLARLSFFFLNKVMPRLLDIRGNASGAARTPWYRHLVARRRISLGNETDWSFFEDLETFAKRFLVWLRDVQANHGDVNLQLADGAPLAQLEANREPARLNDAQFRGSLIPDDDSRGVSLAEMWTRLCEQESVRSSPLKNPRAFQSALYQAAKGD